MYNHTVVKYLHSIGVVSITDLKLYLQQIIYFFVKILAAVAIKILI
jgi:hypothetical protein